MKHLLKSFALLGAIAMLFGTALAACSDSSSSSDDPKPEFKSETHEFTADELSKTGDLLTGGVESITGVESSHPDVVEVSDDGKSITSKKAGEAVLTITDGTEEVFVKVTVAKDGTITLGDPSKEKPEIAEPGAATNVTLDFSKAGPFYADLKAYLNDESAAVKPGKDTTLTADDGVTVVLNGSGKNVSYKYSQDSGFVIKKGDSGTAAPMTIKGVKGDVKVTVIWAIAGKKNASDRELTLSAGDQSKKDGNVDTSSAANPIDVDNETSISYDFGEGGTDINITASNEICIKTITIADPNAFKSTTDDSIANDVATLGIEGTDVSSSNDEVATARISDGKIVITSKKAGNAVIIVTAIGSTSSAQIPVSVNAKGEITLSDVVKISFEGKEMDLDAIKTALDEKLHSRFGTITGVTLKGESSAITVEGNKITSVAEGSGTVTVSDGSNSQDVTVTVAGTGAITLKAGEAPFIAETKTVANTEVSLGVVATAGNVSVTEGGDVASAVLEAGGIKITSKAAGTATISAGDGTKTATITVTVNAKGDVATSVEKYVDPSTVFPNVAASVTLKVTEAQSAAIGAATLPVDDALSCVGCKVTGTSGYGGSEKNWETKESKLYAKLSAATAYLQIKPLVGKFQAGDVLTFDCYLDKNKTFKCWKQADTASPSGTEADKLPSAAGTSTTIKLTLAATDILDDGSIKIGRGDSGVRFCGVTITRN